MEDQLLICFIVMNSEDVSVSIKSSQLPDAIRALQGWRDELRKTCESHRKAAYRFRTLNRILGGLNVLIAAITATAMFAALNKRLENLEFGWQIAITGIAVLPAISSGLQKEWHVTEREVGHLARMQECSVLLREAEFYIEIPPPDWRQLIGSWHKRFRQTISKPTVQQHTAD